VLTVRFLSKGSIHLSKLALRFSIFKKGRLQKAEGAPFFRPTAISRAEGRHNCSTALIWPDELEKSFLFGAYWLHLQATPFLPEKPPIATLFRFMTS
jgi:hypothetical protein